MVDRAGFDRFILLGLSQGARSRSRYAVRASRTRHSSDHLWRFCSRVIASGDPAKQTHLRAWPRRFARWLGQRSWNTYRQSFTSQFFRRCALRRACTISPSTRCSASPLPRRDRRTVHVHECQPSTLSTCCPTIRRSRLWCCHHAADDTTHAASSSRRGVRGRIPGAKFVRAGKPQSHLSYRPSNPRTGVIFDAIADFLGEKRIRTLARHHRASPSGWRKELKARWSRTGSSKS